MSITENLNSDTEKAFSKDSIQTHNLPVNLLSSSNIRRKRELMDDDGGALMTPTEETRPGATSALNLTNQWT